MEVFYRLDWEQFTHLIARLIKFQSSLSTTPSTPARLLRSVGAVGLDM
jgi:hypothetical protein